MYGKMQESGLTEITPLIRTLALGGQCPVFLHPASPQGALVWGWSGEATVAAGFVAAVSFVY